MRHKKETVFPILFIALALLMCFAPFACMLFARTDVTTENRRLASFPALTDRDGKVNVAFLSELGAYFEDHFAFRNQISAADGVVQSLFGVCATDTVVKGTDGWLYYASTLPDYQRTGLLTAGALQNAAHNLALTQRWVTSHGARFTVAVPPNKNTLYPAHMPYYRPAGTGDGNADRLAPLLREAGVNYTDLFALFSAQTDVLYLKQDSHWSNRGALLAYNAICDALGAEHETYQNAAVTRQKNTVGDLGRMAYSVAAAPEWNEAYDMNAAFTYTAGDGDVEAALVKTENPQAAGSLLMFRDSFGNTLLPFFAGAWGSACFCKTTPYLLELYMEQTQPDDVVMEKVERNLADFAKDPPVFTAPTLTLTGAPERRDTESTAQIETAVYDMRFYALHGTADTAGHTNVYVKLNGTCYEAFTVTNETGDNGYLLYLPKEAVPDGASLTLLAQTDGKLYEILETTVDLQEVN